MAFTLPDLPYAHDALEPVIDATTMQVHHGKHHQGYTNKLNNALEGHSDLQDRSIEELLRGIKTLVPAEIRTAVRNSGGGFANHRLFWEVMSPDGGGTPTGTLATTIDEAFGSYSDFKDTFAAAAGGRFGSGWAWLVVDKNHELAVYSTANQDSPLMEGDTPILGLDVWEHAYYLHYQNRRGDYVEQFFEVIDWEAVGEKYAAAKG